VIRLLTQYEQAVFVFQWAKYRGAAADESPGEQLPPFRDPPLSSEELNDFLYQLGIYSKGED
jgi:hypothetical protein